MPPQPEDTPPASPSPLDDLDPQNDPNNEGIDEGDVLEVIDLDELAGLNDEDDDEDEEDGEGAEGEAMEQGGSNLEPAPEDNSATDFDKHGTDNLKSVFCCAIHPSDPKRVLSGGEDDQAYLWNGETGDVIHKAKECKDSVVQVAFNKDGSMWACVDMSGVVYVHKTASGEGVFEFEVSDITSMQWHPSTNVLFATTIDSELWMWKIPSGESKIYMGHGPKAERMKLMPDGKRALVAYQDGTMRLFDLKSSEVIHNLTGNCAHSSVVTALDARSDNTLVASGGDDGLAKLFNCQSGKNIGNFDCSSGGKSGSSADGEEESSENVVESVLFAKPELNYLITGTLSGIITVWDLATQVARSSFSVGTGVVKMEWKNGGSESELLVGTLDGLVRLVDFKSGKVLADFSGHTAAIMDFDQTSNGSHIVTAGDDGHCKVYNVAKVLSAS